MSTRTTSFAILIGVFLPFVSLVRVEAQTLSRADGSTDARSWVEAGSRPTAQSLDGVVAMTHSESEVPVYLNSVGCHVEQSVIHRDNSYFRRFNLPEFGVEGNLVVDSVRIAIEQAVSGTGGVQPLELKLYTLSGEFVQNNLDLLGEESLFVEDDSLALFTISMAESVVVPADSELVVEIFVPDGQEDGHSLFIGSNPDGETDSTYFASEACDVSDPTPVAEVEEGFPDMHLIMTVFGHTVVVGTEPGIGEPRHVVLGQSYPNPPAGDLATIPFELDVSSDVQIVVYDALGRRVALLADSPYAAGSHAVTFDTSGLSGGTYTYRIVANGEMQARRMVVVR